jgi:two-component system, cell cycle sensor histidine kinase and response regulator CckA
VLPKTTIVELERLRQRVRELEDQGGARGEEEAQPLSEPRQSGFDTIFPPTRALLDAEEALAALGAFVWDARTGSLQASAGLVRILGLREVNDLERVLSLVHPEDRRRAKRLAKLVLAGHEAQPTELRLVRANGTVAHLVVQARPELDRRGELSSVAGAAMDITEQKEIESQLLQVQKLEAVGTLAGGMAHDFNNFLQIIGGHSGLLKLDSTLSARSQQSVEEIDAALLRCRELIQRLLAFGRRHVATPTLNEARTLLNGSLRMIERLIGEDVVLRVRTGNVQCPVRIDPVEFEQVVVNLAINARAAMPQGGTLDIDLCQLSLEGEEARLLALPAGLYCCLVVRDTGIGMSADVLARIFEPFFTTKPAGEGTGLGLSTVHGILRRARGNVRASSEPGAGATFYVYLPLSFSEQHFQPPSPIELGMPGGSETVLLVEDSDQVREVVRSQLERAGYRVLVARDADSAIGVAITYTGQIDLLLTDIMLPGMSGPDLELELRKSRPALGVLFMSGYTERVVLRRAAFSRHKIALNKPFSMKELTTVVREHLDSRVASG